MPYGNNNQNGNNQQFSVTSSLVSMFDENSNQLRISGMDSGLQIAIWIPETNSEGRMNYPREKRYSVILSQEAAAAFNDVANKKMLAAYENGQNFKKGVATNRTATNFIELIINDGSVYLRLCKDLDQNKMPKSTNIFKFSKTNLITDYNPQTGEFDIEPADIQLALFCNTLSAYTGIAMAAGHGSHVAMNYSIGRMYQYLQAIASKLGAAVNTSSYGGNNNQSNTTGGSNYPQNSSYNGPVNETSDINALLS